MVQAQQWLSVLRQLKQSVHVQPRSDSLAVLLSKRNLPGLW